MHQRTTDHRGDVTRRKILDAAIGMFGASGFDSVSTRALASQAGVNQPAIQYHFESKEGLYRAAVALIAEDIDLRMRPLRDNIDTLLQSGYASPQAMRGLLLETLDAFTTLMLDEGRHETWGEFIARAEIENETMLETLMASMWDNMVEPMARLLGRITGEADLQASILNTLALLGTVTTFKKRCMRKTIAHALGWKSFGHAEIASIQKVVRGQAEAFLQSATGSRLQ
jgi:AcrR family transcriptional regulator